MTGTQTEIIDKVLPSSTGSDQLNVAALSDIENIFILKQTDISTYSVDL